MKNLSYFFVASFMFSLISLTLQAGVETGVNHVAASSPPSSPKSHGKGINVNEQHVSSGMTSNPKVSARMIAQESSYDKKKAVLNPDSEAFDARTAESHHKVRQRRLINKVRHM
ncbi:uncharacterized protein FA14DRAFT_157202 [Meira miltonrushii]|uniref:Uncharacterized protein n=1 Tax=Meira miltonrushii TaxID=1280837 RepID=A0A316VAE5_9BASI|nr:uncharacterized protein FA14DRAFT_157202 [Meira miltonrushii]PWN32485.1 hypothetical protein FA14DRAFT_157202 [Meira miltonrushii]